jgi:N-acylglucosamine 2-epimerase
MNFVQQSSETGTCVEREDISSCERRLYCQYRELLLEKLVPFWFQYGMDWEHGGVLSCLYEDGSLANEDKFIWSQGRSAWTFSALYNRIEPRPEFIRAAENSASFMLAHGRDAQGRWVYRTDRKGAVIEGPISIYSDCFAVYGLNEYYRATRDEKAIAAALQTFDRVQRRLEEPDFHETAPYPLPSGWRCHGVPMILTEIANELAQTTNDPRLEGFANEYAGRIMRHFLNPRRQAVLEYLARDYTELPPPAGTFIMPGHAIESMCSVMHVAKRQNDRETIGRAAEAMRQQIELGWDKEFGGIFLALDLDGREPYLPQAADQKPWWPHTEALYGTLFAHKLTGESWCWEWHKRIADWAWAHFPFPGTGEWRQQLTRRGDPIPDTGALPVKDPFHLPRAAIFIMRLLGHERALDAASQSQSAGESVV